MEEYVKSIKAYLYDKTVSPLFGMFVASWSFWNYRFIVLLLSDLEPVEKFEYISENLFPDLYAYVFTGFFYPLLSALLFVFFYPMAAHPVYAHIRQKQKALAEIKQQIDDDTPLTKAEAKALRAKTFELEREYEKELAERDRKIQEYKELTDTLERELVDAKALGGKHHSDLTSSKQVPDATQSISNSRETAYGVTESQLEILRRIAEVPLEQNAILEYARGLYPENESEQFRALRAQYDFGVLGKLRLITSSGANYYLTHEGREIVVKSGMSQNGDEKLPV